MKQSKAKSWEQISEGLLTTGEINHLLEKKTPIVLSLSSVPDNKSGHVMICPIKGKRYEVLVLGNVVSFKKYKYLSCSVRLAVKEVKNLTRSGKWRVLPKI
jgi:hypothetical protein